MRGNSLQVNLINIKEKMEKGEKNRSWKTLPWQDFKRKTFHLQCRIYKAMRENNIQAVVKLQQLLINSSATHYIAVKEITSRNISKRLPGIDDKIFLDYSERIELVNYLSTNIGNWKHSLIRQIYNKQNSNIPKIRRILTVKDNVIHYIWKMALEPAHEALFSKNSYGFRPGRTPWDLQKAIYLRLNQIKNPFNAKILIFKVKDCFEKVDFYFLLNNLMIPQRNKIEIFRALKSGILNNDLFKENNKLESGMLSPLLGNIILNGIENLSSVKSTNFTDLQEIENSFSGFRYGSHLIYILEENENADLVINLVTQFLQKRNLKLCELKITKAVDGFDFLEWHFLITQTNKVITYPSSIHWNRYKNKVKSILKNSKYKIQIRINTLKILVREWHIYHQFCDMRRVKNQLYELKKWYSRYMRSNTKILKTERILTLQTIFNNHPYNMFAHKKVFQDKSPFDGDLKYWKKRKLKLYETNN